MFPSQLIFFYLPHVLLEYPHDNPLCSTSYHFPVPKTHTYCIFNQITHIYVYKQETIYSGLLGDPLNTPVLHQAHYPLTDGSYWSFFLSRFSFFSVFFSCVWTPLLAKLKNNLESLSHVPNADIYPPYSQVHDILQQAVRAIESLNIGHEVNMLLLALLARSRWHLEIRLW